MSFSETQKRALQTLDEVSEMIEGLKVLIVSAAPTDAMGALLKVGDITRIRLHGVAFEIVRPLVKGPKP